MRLAHLAAPLPWLVLTLLGCNRSPEGSPSAAGSAAPSASATLPAPVAIALGTVRGRVTIEGDPPPTSAEILAKIPADCASAREFYGPLFRRGPDGALADALVAVTGYRGVPPTRRPVERVTAEGCRWDKRTVAIGTGQRLTVAAKDRFGYVPSLAGGNTPFSMIPVPGGEPVEITPPKAGRFALVDAAHHFIRADVFVLAYSTFDVTGVDGRFEIAEVPAGEVKVNALLPVLMVTAEREIEVRTGEVTEVNLTLRFDERLHRPDPSATPATAASAAPSASAAAAAAPSAP